MEAVRKSLNPIVGMSVNLVILCFVRLLQVRLVKRNRVCDCGVVEDACSLVSSSGPSNTTDDCLLGMYRFTCNWPIIHSLPCLPSKTSEDTLCLLAAGLTMSLILSFFRFRLTGCRVGGASSERPLFPATLNPPCVLPASARCGWSIWRTFRSFPSLYPLK